MTELKVTTGVRLGGGLVMSPSTPLSAENHGGRLVVQTRAGLLVMGIQPVDDGDQFPRASHDLADDARDEGACGVVRGRWCAFRTLAGLADTRGRLIPGALGLSCA